MIKYFSQEFTGSAQRLWYRLLWVQSLLEVILTLMIVISPLCICCNVTHEDLQVVYLSQGHQKHWVYFLCQLNYLWKPSRYSSVYRTSVSWQSQVTTGYTSYFTLFFCLSGNKPWWRRRVFVFGRPNLCFDDEIIPVYYLYLTSIYK